MNMNVTDLGGFLKECRYEKVSGNDSFTLYCQDEFKWIAHSNDEVFVTQTVSPEEIQAVIEICDPDDVSELGAVLHPKLKSLRFFPRKYCMLPGVLTQIASDYGMIDMMFDEETEWISGFVSDTMVFMKPQNNTLIVSSETHTFETTDFFLSMQSTMPVRLSDYNEFGDTSSERILN